MKRRNDLNRLRRLFPRITYMELSQLYDQHECDVERIVEVLKTSQFSSEMQRLSANINQITNLFHQNQFSVCSQRIQHLLHNNRYSSCNNFRDCWCYMMLGSCDKELSRHSLALKHFELSENCLRKMPAEEVKSIKVFHPKILDTMRWRLYHGIGMESRHIDGRFEKSILYLNAALEVLKRILEGSEDIPMSRKRRFLIGQASTLHNLGVLYALMDEYATAIEYYNQASEIWRDVDSLQGLLFAHNNIGVIHQKLSQDDLAIHSWEKVLKLSFLESEIYQPDDIVRTHAPLLVRVLLNMGGLFEQKREYSRSLEYYSRAISIIETLLPHNKDMELRITYRLASLFDRLKKPKRSKKYYRRCVKILSGMANLENASEKAKNPRMKSHPASLNRSPPRNHHHHHQSSQFPGGSGSTSTHKGFSGGSSPSRSFVRDEISVDAFITGARHMIFQNDLMFAKDYLNEAIRIANRKNMRFIGSNLLVALGEVYMRMKEFEHAEKCWTKSLSLKLELIKSLPISRISPASSLPSLQPDSTTPYFVSLQRLVDRLVEACLSSGKVMNALRYAEVFKSVSLVVFLRKDETGFLQNLEKKLLEVHFPKTEDVTVHYYIFKPLDVSQPQKTKEEEQEEEEEGEEEQEIGEEEYMNEEEEEKNDYKIVRWVMYEGRLLYHDVRELLPLIEPYKSIEEFVESFRGIRTLLPQVIEYVNNLHHHQQNQEEKEEEDEMKEMIKEELILQKQFCEKSYQLLVADIEQFFSTKQNNSKSRKQKSSHTRISRLHQHHHHHRGHHRRENVIPFETEEEKRANLEVPHVIFIPHRELFQIPFSVLMNPKNDEYLIEQYCFSISNSVHMIEINRKQREFIRQFRECFKHQNENDLYNRLRNKKYSSQIQFGSHSDSNQRRRRMGGGNNSIFPQSDSITSHHQHHKKQQQQLQNPFIRRRITTSRLHKPVSDGDDLQSMKENEGTPKSLIRGVVIGDPFFSPNGKRIRRRRVLGEESEEESEEEEEEEEVAVTPDRQQQQQPPPAITPIEEYSKTTRMTYPNRRRRRGRTSPLKSSDHHLSFSSLYSLPYAKKEIQSIPKLVSRSPTLLGTGQELVVVLLQKQACIDQLMNCIRDKHPQFLHFVTHAIFPSYTSSSSDSSSSSSFSSQKGGGCLLLSNGERLYAREIASRLEDLKGCEFVYLSCCGGIINNKNHDSHHHQQQQQQQPALPALTSFDEGGSLIKPLFQLGIPSVISALYRINDRIAFEISKGFYSNYFGKKITSSSSSSTTTTTPVQQRRRYSSNQDEDNISTTSSTSSTSSITGIGGRRRVWSHHHQDKDSSSDLIYGRSSQNPSPSITGQRRRRRFPQQQFNKESQESSSIVFGGNEQQGRRRRMNNNNPLQQQEIEDRQQRQQKKKEEENEIRRSELIAKGKMTKSVALRNSILELLRNENAVRKIPFLFGAFQVFGEYL